MVVLANNVNNVTIGVTKAATDIVKSGIPPENSVAITNAAKEMVTINGELLAFVKDFSDNLLRCKYSKRAVPEVMRLSKKLGISVANVIQPAVLAASFLAQKDKLIGDVQGQAKLMATAISELVQGVNEVSVHLGRIELLCLSGKISDAGNNLLTSLGPGSLALVKSIHQSVEAATLMTKQLATVSLMENNGSGGNNVYLPLQQICILSAKVVSDNFDKLNAAVDAMTKSNEIDKQKISTAVKDLNISIAVMIKHRAIIDAVVDARDFLKATNDLLETTKFVSLTTIDFAVQRSIITAFRPLAAAMIQLGSAVDLSPTDPQFIPNLISHSENIISIADAARESLKSIVDGWISNTFTASKNQVKDSLDNYLLMSKSLSDALTYVKEVKI